MKAKDIIRLMGGEFADVPDETLEQWIEVVRPMVSRKQFGKLYEQALALLVAHKLKMGGYGENVLGPLGGIGVGFAVGSVSEGGSSISFGASQGGNLTPDAEYGLTVYGTQFLQLRRMCVVPIHCSGERIDWHGPAKKKKPAGTTGPNGSGSNGPGPSWNGIEDPDEKDGLGWHDMN